jgi:hypothetical protein
MTIPEPRTFSIVGLWCTLAGASLLFFYGFPSKEIGNITLHGTVALRSVGHPLPEDDPAVWQPKAAAYLDRAKILNRLGFGLVVIGTLLQIVRLCGS